MVTTIARYSFFSFCLSTFLGARKLYNQVTDELDLGLKCNSLFWSDFNIEIYVNLSIKWLGDLLCGSFNLTDSAINTLQHIWVI